MRKTIGIFAHVDAGKTTLCEQLLLASGALRRAGRVDHGDMRDQLPYGRVISAGFAELDDGRFLCSGGSQELKVTARPDEDAALLAEALRHRSDA